MALRALVALSLVSLFLSLGAAQPGVVDNGYYTTDDDFTTEVDNVLAALQTGPYSLFAEALANSTVPGRMVTTLGLGTRLTIFAPMDRAFQLYLSQYPVDMNIVLLDHIVPTWLVPSTLVQSRLGYPMRSLGPDVLRKISTYPIQLSLRRRGVTISTATVIQPKVFISKSMIVHGIDNVLRAIPNPMA